MGNKNVISSVFQKKSYFSCIYRKNDFFQKETDIKINDIYKMAFQWNFMGQISFQLPNTLLLATVLQKSAVTDDRIQPILLWIYLNTTLWSFNQWNLTQRIQNRTSNFRIIVKCDSPRIRKNQVFQLWLSILRKMSQFA